MEQTDHIQLFWRQTPPCKFCEMAKALLARKSLDYSGVELGVDMSVEYFKMVNPQITTVPAIFINGVYLGGFNELQQKYEPE